MLYLTAIDQHDLLSASHLLPPVARVTPLKPDAFAEELRLHPDQALASFVVNGLRFGFRLGFQQNGPLKSATRNKPSAYQHPRVIGEYLANEVALGRVAGPFSSPPISNLHVSSFGVIPKKNQPGKWRLIVDLSSPVGGSVNDGIDPDEFSLQYVRLDEIITMISLYGKGAKMAKFDVEAAYRNIPVHPSDRFLLGMKWDNHYFVDLALPFGLRSAPYIFNTVADMVEWMLMNNHGVSELKHYLDDFITVGPPDSDQCQVNLDTAMSVCQGVGLPLHPKKCEGPATSLVILGIELDSVNQTARLPIQKHSALRELLVSWEHRTWCNRHQLESLIGHLHHAAKVCWPGRAFIRRMIDLLRCFRRQDHPIRLNREFHKDLQWWLQYTAEWSGVCFWLFPGMSAVSDLEVTSDAAGAVGYGAIFQDQWFNGCWFPSQLDHSIAYKELFPIVLAAHVWGPCWSQKHILFRSDNQAVVAILNSRSSRDPVLMHLVRNLLMSAARFNFTFKAEHLPGKQNGITDALSRFHWQDFRQLAPYAQPSPVPIPMELLVSLVGHH